MKVTKKKRITKKYTTVKSRHLDDKYHDPVTILSFTMFEILTSFLEKESGNVDWSFSEHHAKAMHQMNHLAFWFNKIYVPYVENKEKYFPSFPSPDPLLIPDEKDPSNRHYVLNKKGNEQFWENCEFISDMDDNMERILIKNMKLLCELSPYMWS